MDSHIQTVTDSDTFGRSLTLTDGRVIPLSEGDVRLLETAFHTHCPDCTHPEE